MANPRLSQKLEAAVKEKLAAEDSHIIAEAAAAATAAGDVPSDSPSLAASSELPDAAGGQSIGSPLVGGEVGVEDEPSVSSEDTEAEGKGGKDGGRRGEVESDGGVLLEPGVASVEELFKSDVFSKKSVVSATAAGGEKGGMGSKSHDVETSDGVEKSKEKGLRA